MNIFIDNPLLLKKPLINRYTSLQFNNVVSDQNSTNINMHTIKIKIYFRF